MRRTSRIAAASLAAALLGGAAPIHSAAVAAAASPSSDACSALAGVQLDDGEIVSAALQAAGSPEPGGGFPGAPPRTVTDLPAFCRVVGRLRPEPGSDINFEVWLPKNDWDGRLSGAGNGGLAGAIGYSELGSAVRAGQAGVSTDTGHQGSQNAAWAVGHPERVRDYGWRAIHLSTVAAKALVARYYGRGPEHAYFIGCSNGGRMGLMEAARFPGDYDGVLAGAPAAVFTEVHVAQLWTSRAQAAPGAAIRPEQVQLLQQEILRQCDRLDGQADGLVDDPRRCRPDLTKLACGVSASPLCFTALQLEALRRIYAGPHDAAGRRVAPGLLPAGAEVGRPLPLGWDSIVSQARPTASPSKDPLLEELAPHPFATAESFDFDRDPARLKAALGADLDVSPDLRRFFRRGGKLIIWQGWADPGVAPQSTLEFRDSILRASGPALAARSMRLFMVPGLQHCLGGPGAGEFGQFTAPPKQASPDRNAAAALQAWVETGRAPDALVGRKGLPIGPPKASAGERLLCAYPERAVLRAGADPDRAASYACRGPDASHHQTAP